MAAESAIGQPTALPGFGLFKRSRPANSRDFRFLLAGFAWTTIPDKLPRFSLAGNNVQRRVENRKRSDFGNGRNILCSRWI